MKLDIDTEDMAILARMAEAVTELVEAIDTLTLQLRSIYADPNLEDE